MTNTTQIQTSTRNTRFGRKETFGCANRYAVQSQTTLLLGEEVTTWVVTDAEMIDELVGLPAIIRQANTREEAVKGLDNCLCDFCSGRTYAQTDEFLACGLTFGFGESEPFKVGDAVSNVDSLGRVLEILPNGDLLLQDVKSHGRKQKWVADATKCLPVR